MVALLYIESSARHQHAAEVVRNLEKHPAALFAINLDNLVISTLTNPTPPRKP